MAKGKLTRFSAPTTTTQQVSNLLAEASSGKQQVTIGSIESISVARIRFDPSQPRKQLVDFNSPRTIAANDPQRERKEAELEGLLELAESIESHGLLQEVGVYLHGHDYVLCWGERRVLAHKLLQREHINAKILPEKPSQLRSKQLIENLHRKDLPLRDLVSGVRDLMPELESPSVATLQAELGLGKSHAYALFALASAPKDVADAIENGRLTSVREAYSVCSISDPQERERVLSGADIGGSPMTTSEPGVNTINATAVRTRGRPATAINLGKTTNGHVARYVVEKLLDPKEFNAYRGADWSDFKVAADILKQVIAKIEAKLSKATT